MNVTQQRQLIAHLAKGVVEQVAPDEVSRFEITSEAYFRNPKVVERGVRDDMLGFGGNEVVSLTPILLLVATKVVGFALEPAKQAATNQISQIVSNFVTMIGAKLGLVQPSQSNAHPLTQEQFVQMRKTIVATLRKYNVPQTKWDMIADTFIAKMAVGQTQNPRSPLSH